MGSCSSCEIEDELRTVGLDELPALDGHGLGHDDLDLVSPRCCDGCERDTGVTGCGLDQDGVLVDLPLALQVVDHRLGDPVLDGSGGVEELDLSVNLRLESEVLLDVRELHHGSVSDRLIY